MSQGGRVRDPIRRPFRNSERPPEQGEKRAAMVSVAETFEELREAPGPEAPGLTSTFNRGFTTVAEAALRIDGKALSGNREVSSAWLFSVRHWVRCPL